MPNEKTLAAVLGYGNVIGVTKTALKDGPAYYYGSEVNSDGRLAIIGPCRISRHAGHMDLLKRARASGEVYPEFYVNNGFGGPK